MPPKQGGISTNSRHAASASNVLENWVNADWFTDGFDNFGRNSLEEVEAVVHRAALQIERGCSIQAAYWHLLKENPVLQVAWCGLLMALHSMPGEDKREWLTGAKARQEVRQAAFSERSLQ